MYKRRVSAIFIAFAVILSALLCSCSLKSEITEKDSARLRELAEALGSDLTEKILPKRSDPDSLTDYDYVVSGKNYSEGTEILAIFYADYKEQADCEVTLILTQGSFVVSRTVFAGGKGYYLRYEYNENNPKSLEVRGQTITGVDLNYQEDSSTWIFRLYDGKREKASFSIAG